jgi:hypothetical protein
MIQYMTGIAMFLTMNTIAYVVSLRSFYRTHNQFFELASFWIAIAQLLPM